MSYSDWYETLIENASDWRREIRHKRNRMQRIYENKIKPKLNKIENLKKTIIQPVEKKKTQKEQELLKRKKILEELQKRAEMMKNHLQRVKKAQLLMQRRLKQMGGLNKRSFLFQRAMVGHKEKEFKDSVNKINQNYELYKQLYNQYQKIINQYQKAIEKYNQKLKEVGVDDLQKAIKEYNRLKDWIKHEAIPRLEHIYEKMEEIAPKVAREKEMELEKLKRLNNKYVYLDGKFYKFSFDGKNAKLEYIPNPDKIVAIELDKHQYPRTISEGAWNNVVDFIKNMSKSIKIPKLQQTPNPTFNTPNLKLSVNTPNLKELEKYRIESLKNNQPIYIKQTGTLFVKGQGYSVAPSKVNAMVKQIQNAYLNQQKRTPSQTYNEVYNLLFK